MAPDEGVSPNSGEEAERRRFWFSWLNDSVKELRAELRVDESAFVFVAAEAQSGPRDYLLYAFLDDVQKAATGILRWTELLSGERAPPDNVEDVQVERIVTEAILDEQSLWTRKLVEGLVTSICFGLTDQEAYYRHYVLLGALRERLATASDLERFYSCPNRNTKAAISRLAQLIADIEASGDIDFDRTWYLRRKTALSREVLERRSAGGIFASEREKYETALAVCSASEKIVLGFSYDRSFGRASRSLHAGPRELGPPASEAAVSSGLEEVAVLGLNLLRRLQVLTGTVPEGAASAQLKRTFEANTEPEALVEQAVRGDAEVGDFVLAYGNPGQVTEIRESDLGYRAYCVVYLAERPLPEIDDDWFPAQEVRVLMRAKELLQRLEAALGSAASEAAERLRANLDEQARLELLRESFVEFWDAVGRDWVRENWFRSSRGEMTDPPLKGSE